MARKHLFLNNKSNKNSGFNRQRFVPQVKKKTETKVIETFRLDNLRIYYSNFNDAYESRYSKRTIEFPKYIDLVEIKFFQIFNSDLRKKFFQIYGLLPVFYSDFNRTVTFEIVDSDLFDLFKEHIEFLIDQTDDVPYSGEEYNLIANIYEFKFIDKRVRTTDEANLIISTINSASTDIANLQKEKLEEFLSEREIDYSVSKDESLIYIAKTTSQTIEKIEENFDIVQSVTSSRAINVRPGMFGSLRMEYGFEVEIPDDLPIVGIIDTGVNQIDPFYRLIEPGGINITNETDDDISGHGTLVAGLTIFGSDLPESVQQSYKAKCKVLPIKVLHHGRGGINFPLLIEAIREANREKGVRIFNMSLAFDAKKYNESFSVYAYELDKLSHELDILIFISVGNFDSDSLKDLLTHDYHPDHEYPGFFYNLNSTSPVHKCENTNICNPSDSLNNISIGALAGNLEKGDNSDLSPANIYPAYYTRKFHIDYEQKINGYNFKRNQKNKHLNKPDLVFDGGDLDKQDAGIEVLSAPGATPNDYFKRTCGTSLSSPIIASIAAEILASYPGLSTQSIKALLINSSGYYEPEKLPAFKHDANLLRKLTGFGIPNKQSALSRDDNEITMIIEDAIKPLEIMTIPIFLPKYLKEAGNKLIFDISLAYSFTPDRGNHLGYVPIHMSFNLMKNLSITDIAKKKAEDTVAKRGFSWSEDHFGKENILFSNTQKKKYKLQPSDLKKLDGEVAVAIRCLIKDNIDESLKQHLENNANNFSIVISIHEEIKNDTGNVLYDEVAAINELSGIGEIQTDTDIDLDAEN